MQSPADGEFGDYGRRRKAIRETFLPNLDNVPGIEAKFVIGQVTDPGLARKIEAEQSRYAKSFLAVDAEVRPFHPPYTWHAPLCPRLVSPAPASATL